ncbi:MAG: pyridoxamine 5'-phosphate oxidase family protein [Sphingobacteriales bacterium]|nr:pyridoxamine 5'-phosphate oxidase family protein [Sphingobacteriales bacterium]
MNEKIAEFIARQTCGNLACVDEAGQPWCFSFFYSFNAEAGLLHYKSSMDTRHAAILSKNPVVAGTILPDKLNLLQIKGIQFEGELLPLDHPLAKHASAHYHKKHPVALAMPGDVWTIRINHIKFTDNSLGIGKKLNWKRDE